jgi:hypothetical protein
VLRRIFGPKRDEVTGEWRKLLNEELNDLFISHIVVQVIKLRRMRWVGHVAHRRERVLVVKPKERDHLEDPGIDGRVLCRWIFRKWDVRAWNGLMGLRIGTGGGLL